MNLENIARKAARPLVIAGASAYMILNLLSCTQSIPAPTAVPNTNPKPSPTATYTPVPTIDDMVTVTPVTDPIATPTATPMPKSTYELALEKLNPQISQTARDFIKNLAEYNDSVGNTQELHKTYTGLEKVIEIVERHPRIVNGLNMFGNDALALLLSDNQGIVDMDKFWFLTNATALQAQDFFYAANKFYENGAYKDRMSGSLTNGKFDGKEREIVNFRLRKQIEWQGKWSTPLEYEKAVQEYGSEQRATNALRWRVLPQRLFVDDVVNGGTHPTYSTFDSNTWLTVASSNN